MSLSFKEVLLRVPDSCKLGFDEFIFKERESRTIQQVVMTLAVARLHSVPVYLPEFCTYKLFGLWDVLPIIIHIIEDKENRDEYNWPTATILENHRKTFSHKLRGIIGKVLADRPTSQPFVPVNSRNTMYDIVELMLDNEYTQVSIVDDNNSLANVITPEQLIRVIYVNRVRLDAWYLAATVRDFDMGGSQPLCTVLSTDPVINAFALMHEKKVPCVAVVNARNKLIGCINLNDLNIIFKPKRSINDLFLTASNFIELGLLMSKGVVPAPYAACATCRKDTTMREILNHAIRYRTFNFFLINPDHTIDCLITATDIIRAFFTAETPLACSSSPVQILSQLTTIGSPHLFINV